MGPLCDLDESVLLRLFDSFKESSYSLKDIIRRLTKFLECMRGARNNRGALINGTTTLTEMSYPPI